MFCSYVDPFSECYYNNKESKTKGIHSIPKNAIVEIIFGARMSFDDSKKIIDIIKRDKDCDHIAIKYMALDRKQYKLKEFKILSFNHSL